MTVIYANNIKRGLFLYHNMHNVGRIDVMLSGREYVCMIESEVRVENVNIVLCSFQV